MISFFLSLWVESKVWTTCKLQYTWSKHSCPDGTFVNINQFNSKSRKTKAERYKYPLRQMTLKIVISWVDNETQNALVSCCGNMYNTVVQWVRKWRTQRPASVNCSNLARLFFFWALKQNHFSVCSGCWTDSARAPLIAEEGPCWH